MEQQDDDPVIIVDLPEDNSNFSPHKRDGERSANRGPCPCGFRHWCEGKEYDFVFQWPGIKALGGFNITDNAFTVAEEYVTKYHRSAKWDHRHVVNQIAHAIMRQTVDMNAHHDVVKPAEKVSGFDPYKEDYNVPQTGTTRYNKVTQQFEKTIYPLNETQRTPEEEAEIKRKQAILEENQKKLMKEKEEEDKRREGIVEIIRRDRLEQHEEIKLPTERPKTQNTSGKIPKVEGGVIVWVDPPSIKSPKGPVNAPTLRTISDISHHHHPHPSHVPFESDSDDEDEIEKLSQLPKMFWNDHIFLSLLHKHGEEITKKVMLTVGFGESELEEILFKGKEHLKRHKKAKLKEKDRFKEHDKDKDKEKEKEKEKDKREDQDQEEQQEGR